MDQTLIALAAIILKAIPTFCLVWILYFYVSRFFLAPLEKTLHQRREATEGLRQAAEARVSQAEQRAATYQEALRSSSAEIYRQQERDRQKAMDQRAEALRQARAAAEERVKRAKQEIQQDAEAAKQQLEQESEQMAQWIARAILEPPPASAGAGARG